MPQIKVQEVDVQAERRRRRKKTGLLAAGAVAVLVSAAGLSWYYTPPAIPETIAEAQALVESSRFARLSQQQKQPYLDVIREQFGSLDPEERRAMVRENQEMRNALRASRNAEREAFTKAYVLASPSERAVMLEQLEAERQARRAERENNDRGGEGRPRGGPSDERINDRATNGSAQSSQLRSEMRRERRRSRSSQ